MGEQNDLQASSEEVTVVPKHNFFRRISCARCFKIATARDGKDACQVALEQGWMQYKISSCSFPWLCDTCGATPSPVQRSR